MVDPSLTAPYSILVCFARSSAESMGASIRSTVRKAAKLAVIASINPRSYLAITKSTQLTPVQASSTYIQMSGDRGLRKENTPGLVPLGLR
ncbi:hypothetical protein EYF80_030695 [Liparis tanakae]|uniref:Uncharacterized protein n=1 Tax=Liparis tanakae TaxID=230148 RepID=A0A4Z2H0E1_9TELE|nr:hypothetical protein EYF80_030695 [Liparis tanakae]